MRFWTAIGLIVVLSATGLTYEIAAGRVLAPFFGASLLTWTAVIATVLAGFSIGNAIGGVIAERERGRALRSMRAALVATAVLAALTPTILGLVHALGARGTGGMFLSVVIAFLPASILISAPSPLLATLAVEARPGREGSSLGMVLAAGSLGAILGAVLAGFVALPLIGSAATFAACAALVLLCVPALRDRGAGGGGGGERTSMAHLLPVAALVAASAALGPVCRYESGLSCIDVARTGRAVHLYSDGVQQAAEEVARGPDPDAPRRGLILPYTEWIWARMQADLGPAPAVLFIGGGGYTLPTRLLTARPEAAALAVEIDPLITEVVQRHLPWAAATIAEAGHAAAPGTQPRPGGLGIHHADGRVYLNEADAIFDAAVLDAFSSASVPAHLVTLESFAQVRRIVDGPVYVNLIDRPDGPLARGTHAILAELYPNVRAVQGPLNAGGTGNIVIAASPRPLEPLTDLPHGFAEARITPVRPFTDDRGWAGYR